MSSKTATLEKFARELAKLPRVLAAKVAERAAERITELGRETFEQQQDAYGNEWEPGHDGKTVDLVESGALENNLKYVAIGTKLRSSLGVPYAKYQIGKRPVYPKGTLPPAYVEELQRTAVEVIKEELGKP